MIFEKCNNSKSTHAIELDSTPEQILKSIPDNLLRKDLGSIPDVSESEVVRHYIELSSLNYGVDTGFYPLGSCTMKYNPKINERIASMEGFTNIHPYSDQSRVQGTLEVLHKTAEALKEITGMDAMSLVPCAGAHGELTGLFVIRAYFKDKKEDRNIVLVPDSAHGTNPASASMAGFKTVTIKSDEDGFVSIEDLETKVNKNVAALMLTNPNTLGQYEKKIQQISEICKKHGIQLYYDGANLNAILGISRPGDTGFDVVHLNLHKTFSTPHGGGGPGSGPIGVKKHLINFLPNRSVEYNNQNYSLSELNSKSIGQVRAFYSNFLVILKAYTYIVSLGGEGLRNTGYYALLNANYLAAKLKDHYELAGADHVMHEFVISLTKECKLYNLTIVDFAKRILDYGYHAPTMSFPLIVHDCLMIEPTETETKDTLDKFAEVMITILNEAKTNCDLLRNAPVNTPIKRPDDVSAARNPILRYHK